MIIKSFFSEKTKLISNIDRALKLYRKHQISTVLDLGSGTNPHGGIRSDLGIREILVDIYQNGVAPILINKSFLNFNEVTDGLFDITGETKVECVVGLHIIEHVEKEKGIQLISQMTKWANKLVIIETPNGYVRQDASPNNPFQKHLCGYTTKELKNLGFTVKGTSGLKFLKHNYNKGQYKWNYIWVRIIDRFLSKVLCLNYFPQISFNLFAYKVLSRENQ